MSIVVTGATGQLGHLVVEDLLASGVAAADIVATGRDLAKVQDLAERGVTVRALDFSDPASLDGAFSAGDRVLLVSTNEMGQRAAQHQAVIDAAAAAGVAQLVYTSAPKATTTPMRLAAEHKATEEAIAASGVPATILRNGWYIENYSGQLATFIEHGAILGSAGDGRFSIAARADYAEAAAAVLAAPVADHVGKVYELGGDESLTLADIAAAFTASTGHTIVYADVPAAEHLAALVGAGLPEPVAEIFVDVDQSAARGALEVAGHDLSTLIGHPTTTLAEALAP
jgi:NAD(P)H dehydrogenase (quinone)